MSVPETLTAEEFIEHRFDLPDGGRWSELVGGQVVTFQPPDERHGAVVLNLSKAVAAHLRPDDDSQSVYACFDLGLVVRRGPDTVRFPQFCFFTDGRRFARADDTITEDPPALVVEVASTNDRRRGMPERVGEFLAWGVPSIWIADPIERQWHVHSRARPARQLAAGDTLSDDAVLPGFSAHVGELFAEPEWWRR